MWVDKGLHLATRLLWRVYNWIRHECIWLFPFFSLHFCNRMQFIHSWICCHILQVSFFIISPCLQKFANRVWRLYHIFLMITSIFPYENQIKLGQNCCLKVNILLSCLHLINKIKIIARFPRKNSSPTIAFLLRICWCVQ
jgi:hypothetical protein